MTDSEGHPHADLMLLYAQRSKTDAEEWRNWEYEYSHGKWSPTGVMPQWNAYTQYRRKPEPKTLYAVIDVQHDEVTYYADEVDAYDFKNSLGEDARIEKYIQVLE